METIGTMLGDISTSLFRRPATEFYPAERNEAPMQLRGELQWDPKACTGCGMCSMDCPARAIQVTVFDKKAKRMTVSVEPSVLQGKLFVSGTMHTEPAGEGQCRRIYENTVVAKVFGIGGMIESRILQDVRKSYDKAAAFTNRWVKEHPA